MLEHTKEPHTDTVELRFRGPAAMEEKAVKALKDLGFESADTIPWREAFPDITTEEAPAVCLRAMRRRQGLTQKDLAERSGIPQAHISLMERGKATIGITRAKRLGKALKTGYKVFL